MSMSNLTNNFNLLSNVGFKLVINSHEFANTEFFVVSASLPSVSINEAPAPFRNQSGFVPGEKMEFDTFNVRVAIDEDFASYTEIFNWIHSHTNQNDLKVADISLIVMTSHNNANKTFTFINAFPTNIGSVEFNAQAQDVEYAYVDVTFRYDYFKISDAAGDSLAGFC